MDATFFLSNLIMVGEKLVTEKDGDKEIKKAKKTVISIDGYDLEFTQKDWAIIPDRDLEKTCFHSTDVLVSQISDQDFEKVKKIISQISYLLSFILGSNIQVMGYSIDGKERYQQSTSGLHDRFRPLIDYNQPKDIKYFVETCWPQYNSISEDRKLPAVIDTLLIPDIKNLPLEVRLATLFIAVENLKTTYAEKVAGYTFKGGHFYDGNDRKGFKALVTEMLGNL